ncbi:MAG: fluoride efflux transporter CrcB [Hyphomonadaceae bacterium]
MQNLFLVMIGGAIGAGLRHLTSGFMLRRLGPDFPFGTLSVNVLGSLLLGLLVGVLAFRGGEHQNQLRALIGTGVMGGFTTFSAYSLETALMIEEGRYMQAGGYALGSVAAGVLAVFVGLWIARRVFA